MKKIAVVTGTRAEYGLLKRLIKLIDDSSKLQLQLLVTGTHLSPEYGLTKNEILDDQIPIYDEVDIQISSDTSLAIAKSSGIAVLGFADALKRNIPDIIVVLGDRYEILSACFSALILQIPIAHIHGGEITEAVMDDSIRHAITKLSAMHFPATNEYKKRIMQMGEQPNMIFTVGGLGVDAIKNQQLLSKSEFETLLEIKFMARNLLVTFHPVPKANQSVIDQVHELLNALSKLDDTLLLFTLPNADIDGRIVIEIIKDFCYKNQNSHFFASLGQRNYLSCIQYVDAVLGNSSSGLLEVPSFFKPTINIGDRQKGRLKAKSVIDCPVETLSILRAIKKCYSKSFLDKIKMIDNPYGEGGASEKILEILETVNLTELNSNKVFYDIDIT